MRVEYEEFYATVAQIVPVLLLALMWDSGFLQRLRQQRRPKRRDGSPGVLFWTKPRVRAYTIFVTLTLISVMICGVLVLGGLIPDSRDLRWAVSGGLMLAGLTLLTRITVDVILATREKDQSE